MSSTALLALMWRPYVAPLPLWAGAVLLAALAVTACVRGYSVRPWLAVAMLAMRLVLIVLLTLLLMGPSELRPSAAAPGRAHLTVMLDTSASMQTADMQGIGRLDFAVQHWLGQEQLTRLSADHRVNLIAFDEAPRALLESALRRPAEDLAAGRETNVAQSVTSVVSEMGDGAAGSALVLISDGHDTLDESVRPVADLARARSVPIHTVTLGGPDLQRDLSLVAIPEPDYLFVGEKGRIVAKVLQAGAGDATTTVRLRGSGEHVERRVAFDGRRSVTVNFDLEPQAAGLHEYRIGVDPLDGEIEPANNEQVVFVEVTDERIKVLVLEGQPFWDTKYLAQSLRADESIELMHVTQITSKRRQSIVTRTERPETTIPATLEQWAAYDVIVIGRGIEHLLTPQAAQMLRQLVSEHGGQIVFARGRAYDPTTEAGREIGRQLAALEPVVWGEGLDDEQSITLTRAGNTHPAFSLLADGVAGRDVVGQLPPLSIVPAVVREKAAAIVLARAGSDDGAPATGQPAVLSMAYGRGKVVAIIGEGLWRWRLLPDDMADLEGVFDRFWSNMIRWLALGSEFQPGRQVSLRLSRSAVQTGQTVRFDVVSRFAADDHDMRLTVVDPHGQAHDLALQAAGGVARQQAMFEPTIAGVHEVALDAPSMKPERIETRFNVYNVDVERLRSAANPLAMRQLAEQSGGVFLAADRPDALFDVLQRQRTALMAPAKTQYIWDRGWILTSLLIWAGIEWIARRRGGLL